MKLALVTIVTANLEPMRTFYQQVLQIEPQIYRGNYVEFTLEAGTLALWRQSECAAFGLGALRGTANDRVLIELAVADVDAEYARLHRPAGRRDPGADEPSRGANAPSTSVTRMGTSSPCIRLWRSSAVNGGRSA